MNNLNPCPVGPEDDGAPQRPADRELAGLVAAAAGGDPQAWNTLVRRFDPKLRAVARSYRLSSSDVDDVVQATWVKCFEHIREIRNPSAISSWLKTTTRRNALATLQMPVRERVTDDPCLGDGADTHGPEEIVLAAELRETLLRAMQPLPERHRALMVAFATEASTEYSEISAQLAIPRGSIGPIRARALTRLAQDPRVAALRP
jgi:RNA polymerase sigma factor (sigma-70 family)